MLKSLPVPPALVRGEPLVMVARDKSVCATLKVLSLLAVCFGTHKTCFPWRWWGDGVACLLPEPQWGVCRSGLGWEPGPPAWLGIPHACSQVSCIAVSRSVSLQLPSFNFPSILGKSAGSGAANRHGKIRHTNSLGFRNLAVLRSTS